MDAALGHSFAPGPERSVCNQRKMKYSVASTYSTELPWLPLGAGCTRRSERDSATERERKLWSLGESGKGARDGVGKSSLK